MRILFANKFWYRRGGLERVMFDEIAWLERAGHEIAHFATSHPHNEPSPWSSHFVPYADLSEKAPLSVAQKSMTAARLFHNREAARRFARLVDEFRPDIVHAHGIHRQISPSVLDVARSVSVPVAHTLHDYHLICPADTLMYRGTEPCKPRRCGALWFGPCVGGRCVRSSLAASSLSAAETAWARAHRSYQRAVKRFICPSEFMRDQMRQADWRIPLDVIPNAVVPEPARMGAGSGFVIIGRLSREKGVGVAIEAARSARVDLTVAGDGPLRAQLEEAHPEIKFTGHLGEQAIGELVRSSRAVIAPSLCFENAPMSVLEAMAAGVPVIASNIGGVPEQVTDSVNGLLVTPGDISRLAQAMKRLDDDPAFAERLGVEARRTVVERFSPSAHLAALEKTYEACLKS